LQNITNKLKDYEDLALKGKDKIIKHYKQYASVTDLEQEACVLNSLICKYKQRNIINIKPPEINIGLHEYLLNVILEYRAQILNSNFKWNYVFKKQLLELNKNIKNGFSSAYKQAVIVFENTINLMKSGNAYLNDFNLSINLKPFILEPNKDEYYLEERGDDSIYYIIYNKLQKTPLWSDEIIIYRDDFQKSKKELLILFNEKLNNIRFDKNDFTMNTNTLNNINNQFDCCIFGFAWCQLISSRFLSWYDILKINEIWVEVNVTHQHFIEEIGKSKFWDDSIQSLSDNEAENIRQEYMSRLSKRETGLPVHIFLDEIGAWDNIGNFKRIKFRGKKSDKPDHTNIYSMSIEKNPRVLVRNAKIDITDEELNQVKDFVSRNEKELLKLANQKISFLDFINIVNNKIGRIIPEVN